MYQEGRGGGGAKVIPVVSFVVMILSNTDLKEAKIISAYDVVGEKNVSFLSQFESFSMHACQNLTCFDNQLTSIAM